MALDINIDSPYRLQNYDYDKSLITTNLYTDSCNCDVPPVHTQTYPESYGDNKDEDASHPYIDSPLTGRLSPYSDCESQKTLVYIKSIHLSHVRCPSFQHEASFRLKFRRTKS